MKLKTIQISNILSFPHVENINDAEKIVFNHSTNDSLNIIVGANGSGKSNFLEIINYVFKNAISRPVSVNEEKIETYNTSDETTDMRKDSITYASIQSSNTIPKNWFSKSDVRKIKLSLEIDENDYYNIQYLIQNKELINQISKTYSVGNVQFNVEEFTQAQFDANKLITYIIHKDTYDYNGMFSVHIENSTEEKELINNYLRNFDFFVSIINFYNNKLKKEGDIELRPLYQSFYLMGVHRSLIPFSLDSTIKKDKSKELSSDIVHMKTQGTRIHQRNGTSPSSYFSKLLAYDVIDLLEQGGKAFAEKKILENPNLIAVNGLIKKYFNSSSLQVEITDLHNFSIKVTLNNAQGIQLTNNDLSSGEKEILSFIFSIYGLKITNGLIIIDEPELHLHPQLQKNFLNLIEEIQKENNIQFIIATHSPVYINKESIKYVHRFYKGSSGATKVITPTEEVLDDKKKLDFISYTNTSKIFFVNTVILVEGKTDEYFFNKFFDYLKDLDSDTSGNEWIRKIENYEILNVGGKNKFNDWSNFLKSFGINTYVIGDWDNIKEYFTVNIKAYQEAYMKALEESSKAIQKSGSLDFKGLLEKIDAVLTTNNTETVNKLQESYDYVIHRHYSYSDLIAYLKINKSSEWSSIESSINSLYSENVFILKEGELEDYLGFKNKRIDSYIDFCQSENFDKWVISNKSKSSFLELINISKNIFK